MDLIAMLFLFNLWKFIYIFRKCSEWDDFLFINYYYTIFLSLFKRCQLKLRVLRRCARYNSFIRSLYLVRAKSIQYFFPVRDRLSVEIETELINNGWPYRDTHLMRSLTVSLSEENVIQFRIRRTASTSSSNNRDKANWILKIAVA